MVTRKKKRDGTLSAVPNKNAGPLHARIEPDLSMSRDTELRIAEKRYEHAKKRFQVLEQRFRVVER